MRQRVQDLGKSFRAGMMDRSEQEWQEGLGRSHSVACECGQVHPKLGTQSRAGRAGQLTCPSTGTDFLLHPSGRTRNSHPNTPGASAEAGSRSWAGRNGICWMDLQTHPRAVLHSSSCPAGRDGPVPIVVTQGDVHSQGSVPHLFGSPRDGFGDRSQLQHFGHSLSLTQVGTGCGRGGKSQQHPRVGHRPCPTASLGWRAAIQASSCSSSRYLLPPPEPPGLGQGWKEAMALLMAFTPGWQCLTPSQHQSQCWEPQGMVQPGGPQSDFHT